jgi:hypothetical protein
MVATSRSADIERYCQNLKGEVDGAALYRLLADAKATPELAEVTATWRAWRTATPSCGGPGSANPAWPLRS